MKILLLSASTGAGHLTASAALATEMAARGWEVESLDCMDFSHKAFRSWFKGGYEWLVKKWPGLWGALYRASDRLGFAYHFQTWLDRAQMSRLDGLVEGFQPDWVVCTHSLPQPRLGFLQERIPFRLAVVVTDLYPHRMWLRGQPDLWCVPTDWSETVLTKRLGMPDPPIAVTGMPIGSSFHPAARRANRTGAIPKLLVSSGGIGGGPILDAVKALASLDHPVELHVLCGNNAPLKSTLDSQSFPGPVKIISHGLLSNPAMAEQMQAASLIIGKPGGLTTFEALASGLPFVILDPFLIPGQEERNAEYLVEIGAGIRVSRIVNLAEAVKQLLNYPTRLQSMQDAAVAHARPGAAKAVTDLLEEGIGQRAIGR